MKLSSQAILKISTYFLGLLMVYTLGRLGGTLVNQQILSLPLPPPKATNVRSAPAPRDQTLPEEQFSAILENNIFQAQRAPRDEVTPGVAAPTTLNLSLVGTMIYEKTAFAFISPKGREGQYVAYQKDDCFVPTSMEYRPPEECTANTAKILSIEDRLVTLKYQNKMERLEMVEAKAESFETAFPQEEDQKKSSPYIAPIIGKPPQTSKPPSTASTAAPPGKTTFHFQREWVDEQLANFNKLLRDARVVPTVKDGKTYFTFKYVKTGSLYEQLGLRKGDIILEINGFAIDNVTKALSLLETLKSEREIILKVDRGGQIISFNYYID